MHLFSPETQSGKVRSGCPQDQPAEGWAGGGEAEGWFSEWWDQTVSKVLLVLVLNINPIKHSSFIMIFHSTPGSTTASEKKNESCWKQQTTFNFYRLNLFTARFACISFLIFTHWSVIKFVLFTDRLTLTVVRKRKRTWLRSCGR